MPAPDSSPPPRADSSGKPGARRDRAWGLVMLNQFALPGAGTLMAGRKAGYLQLCLSLTGIGCLTTFITYTAFHLGELLEANRRYGDDPDAFMAVFAQWKPWLMVAGAGVVLVGIAWLWSLVTSASVLRSAVRESSDRRD